MHHLEKKNASVTKNSQFVLQYEPGLVQCDSYAGASLLIAGHSLELAGLAQI